MAQKFILTSHGFIRMGDVGLHRELLLPSDVCLGGGFYHLDYVASRLVLDGASYDYGRPQWGALPPGSTLNVPIGYKGLGIVYEAGYHHKETLDLAQEYVIEYY